MELDGGRSKKGGKHGTAGTLNIPKGFQRKIIGLWEYLGLQKGNNGKHRDLYGLHKGNQKEHWDP